MPNSVLIMFITFFSGILLTLAITAAILSDENDDI